MPARGLSLPPDHTLSPQLTGVRPVPEPFEFVTVDALLDSDLLVVLAECQLAERNDWRVPAYLFRLQTESGEHAGRIRLRVGWNDDIIKYAGQIGYAVEPEARVRSYGESACRLL